VFSSSPSSIATATRDPRPRTCTMASSSNEAFTRGTLTAAMTAAFKTKSFTVIFGGIRAFARGLQFLARFHERSRINVDREIEVWNRAEDSPNKPLRDDFAHPGKLNARTLARLNRSRRFRCRFCAAAVNARGYRFRRSANVGFGNATVRPRTFHDGKIHTKFRCDSARQQRSFHAGFFGFLFSRLRLLLRPSQLGRLTQPPLHLVAAVAQFFLFGFRARGFFGLGLALFCFLLCWLGSLLFSVRRLLVSAYFRAFSADECDFISPTFTLAAFLDVISLSVPSSARTPIPWSPCRSRFRRALHRRRLGSPFFFFTRRGCPPSSCH